VARLTDPSPGVLFGGEPSGNDVGTGTIYVLRSLSKDANISKHRDILHKIGVTSSSVKKRIANAENESTYLLAPVEIVATYELYNINSTKLENMLHRYFDAARADITIKDRFGKPVQPKEWFFLTLASIREVVKRLEDGSITRSRYDPATGKIVDL
jgi:T5orf172 domain